MMKRRVDAARVGSDSVDHAWERERSRAIARFRQVVPLVGLLLIVTAGVGGIALVVHPVCCLGESRRIVAPVTEVGLNNSAVKTAHDHKNWNGEPNSATPDTGRSHLRGVPRPFESKQSLERARRHTVPRDGDNQHSLHEVADLSGDVQDPGPSVNSAIKQGRDPAGLSATGPIGDDRPRPVQSVDGMHVEAAANPSTTKPASGVEGVTDTGNGTAPAALAGVAYGEQKGQQYGQQHEQPLERTPVAPMAAAATPAQLSMKGQVDQPLGENIRDQGPDNRLELGGIHEERQRQQKRESATPDIQAELRANTEDVQDQQAEQVQDRQQQQPNEHVQEEDGHLAPGPGHLENADRDAGLPFQSSAGNESSAPLYESFPQGATAVWSRLLDASSSDGECLNPPCGKGKHIHDDFADLGEEMARVRGAVVVRRPDLIPSANLLTAANKLDFAKTVQAYSPMLRDSLLPRILTGQDVRQLRESFKVARFFDGIRNGTATAGKYLSSYYAKPDVATPKSAENGYEAVPTLVSMADVFINERGYVWNKQDYIVPKSCRVDQYGPSASMALPSQAHRHAKVFIMTQHWGEGYFHFLAECLPRITLMLDVLLEHPEIKIAVHESRRNRKERVQTMFEFMELLGIHRQRVIFISKEIHADIAILPESTPCGRPNTAMVSMLRPALLQGIYPLTGGVPPPVPRPVILLIVRRSKRMLRNNDKIRKALEQTFPVYEVVEFFGEGPIVEQLQMFSTASLIVAPHGAGLTNMMVSPLHTAVLEIGPPDCSICYIHLTIKLQHIYGRHLAGKRWDGNCNSAFEPNVGEIVKLASDLLEAKLLVDATYPPNGVYEEANSVVEYLPTLAASETVPERSSMPRV